MRDEAVVLRQNRRRKGEPLRENRENRSIATREETRGDTQRARNCSLAARNIALKNDATRGLPTTGSTIGRVVTPFCLLRRAHPRTSPFSNLFAPEIDFE